MAYHYSHFLLINLNESEVIVILKTASLTPDMLAVIQNKGTEQPYSGEYDTLDQPGTYLCRQCGLALYRAEAKFPSGCGWPSFDKEIPGNVMHEPDQDGRRTEILCRRCHAHLGHVFHGEGLTPLNTRHCVNSLSLDFVNNLTVTDTEEGIFAGGCFWGMEYYFRACPGVVKTEVGYTGGVTLNPTYDSVCHSDTRHYEATRVLYDPSQLSYEKLVKYFFEIHHFAQDNGQGPDIGLQYQSALFFYDESQHHIAESIILLLKKKNEHVATKLLPVSPFWRAENYHQQYYQKQNKLPYCHSYEKKFDL